jgi:hypothetical protein
LKLVSQIPHNVCVCVYHENVRLIIDALQPILDLSSVIPFIVCDEKDQACMLLECSSCGMDRFDEYIQVNCNEQVDMATSVIIQQWENSFKKELPPMTLKDAVSLFRAKLPDFLPHVYIKRQQSRLFRDCRMDMESHTLVIQVNNNVYYYYTLVYTYFVYYRWISVKIMP